MSEEEAVSVGEIGLVSGLTGAFFLWIRRRYATGTTVASFSHKFRVASVCRVITLKGPGRRKRAPRATMPAGCAGSKAGACEIFALQTTRAEP